MLTINVLNLDLETWRTLKAQGTGTSMYLTYQVFCTRYSHRHRCTLCRNLLGMLACDELPVPLKKNSSANPMPADRTDRASRMVLQLVHAGTSICMLSLEPSPAAALAKAQVHDVLGSCCCHYLISPAEEPLAWDQMRHWEARQGVSNGTPVVTASWLKDGCN